MKHTREEIIQMYNELQSMRTIEKETGISYNVVRRVLVESGIYPSLYTEFINTMYQSGMSIQQIAKQLRVTPKAISTHLPHTKGCYALDEPTQNALKIRKTREKQRRKLDDE